MPYAHIDGGVIDAAGEVLPAQARRLDTNELITNLASQTVEVQEATGWFVIDTTTNPRPADTPTTYWASSFGVVVGRPVESWTEFAKTPKMIEDEGRATKRLTISTDATSTAYDRLRQIVGYTPPNLASARLTTISTTNTYATNALRDAAIRDLALWIVGFLVEWNKATPAIQDEARYLQELARLFLSGAMLDADKD